MSKAKNLLVRKHYKLNDYDIAAVFSTFLRAQHYLNTKYLSNLDTVSRGIYLLKNTLSRASDASQATMYMRLANGRCSAHRMRSAYYNEGRDYKYNDIYSLFIFESQRRRFLLRNYRAVRGYTLNSRILVHKGKCEVSTPT